MCKLVLLLFPLSACTVWVWVGEQSMGGGCRSVLFSFSLSPSWVRCERSLYADGLQL